MATYQRAEGAPSPVHNQSAPSSTQQIEPPQPKVRYVDKNGNPVAAPAPTAVQEKPPPIIKYIDQNGNPVSPPVEGQQILKYIDQNGNPVAPPTNAAAVTQQLAQQVQQQSVVVTQPQPLIVDSNDKHSTQQFGQGGGSCLRITLIILWIFALYGGMPQLILGALFIWGNEATSILSLLLPGLVVCIGGSISIYGLLKYKYNYRVSMVSFIASGVLILFGILLLMVEDGTFWFLIAYAGPLAIYLNLFAFSTLFTKHLLYVEKNGHPDPNTCCSKNCGDDGCCAPRSNQRVIYQQPGVALQAGNAAQPAKDGAQQSDAPGQDVDGVNHMDNVSQAMMTNGGYCWRVTLIILWSCALFGSLAQFILGCLDIDDIYGDANDLRNLSLSSLIPGLIGVIVASISIYGVSKYNYNLNVFSCVALGLLLSVGLILLPFEHGVIIFVVDYSGAFIWYSLLLGFSIKFTRKIKYIEENGHADDVNDDCCKGCYDCCQCQKGCGAIYTYLFV